MKNSLALVLVSILASSCMATKTASLSSPLSDGIANVHVGEGSVSGIYRFDLETGGVSQVVAIPSTSEITKYAVVRSADTTTFYLVGDQDGAKNLYRAQAPNDGSATATPTKILGNDDLNGPAVCGGGESLVVGQRLPGAVQVIKVPLPSAAGPVVVFKKNDFVAGDLHCRRGIEGFFFAGLPCPSGGGLGQCFSPTNDAVTKIFHMVGGEAVPVSAPELDPDVTALPRTKRYGRGDVDPVAARLSDGRLVVGFSRIFNSPLLADAPQSKRDEGYFKLMLAVTGTQAGEPAKETQVDLASYFRKVWQVPDSVPIDYLLSTVDIRPGSGGGEDIELVTAASLNKRGAQYGDHETFNGLVYARFGKAELGKAKADLLEMRPLITIKQFSCGIWKAKGLGEPDGNVYVYGAVFPRFVEAEKVLHFSTLRGKVGDYVAEGEGSIRLENGNVVPGEAFLQAFCGS